MMSLGMLCDLVHIDAVAVARHHQGGDDEPGDETAGDVPVGILTEDDKFILTEDGKVIQAENMQPAITTTYQAGGEGGDSLGGEGGDVIGPENN